MRNADGEDVFRGHWEDCLGHFSANLASKAPKGSLGVDQSRKPVADFCGVATRSVARWLQGQMLPTGETLIKLMCFLEMAGYRVIELERMSTPRRKFAELIGFGLLSGKEAADILGYSAASTLFRVLQGRSGASDDRDQRMWDMWMERRKELERKKEEVVRRQPRKAISSLTAVVSIMEALLALLEDSPLDELPEDELASLPQTAVKTILRLAAHLSTLSSRLMMSESERRAADDERGEVSSDR